MFLKSIIIENFVIADDNYVKGQNYQLYHKSPEDATSADMNWVLIQYDFDENFSFDSLGVPSSPNVGVFDYYLQPTTDYNPLSNRILMIPSIRSQYMDLYAHFITSVFARKNFNDGEVAQLPDARFEGMYSFIEPWVANDKFWQISCGMTPAQFKDMASVTMENLPLRYRAVFDELKSLQTGVKTVVLTV
jgi:hypothetical protein